MSVPKRSTRAKDPSKDKRKITWKSNLAKAQKVQQDMKKSYENQKLKELQIYDDSESDSEDSSSGSDSEDEYVIKPKKGKAKKKAPAKASKNSVLEELKAMREEVNKLRREKKKSNKNEKGTVIQVMTGEKAAPKENDLVTEMKRKALINF